MRILHTSDWHLGHELYGLNRRDEFEAMIDQVKETIVKHRPDAMVIAGDVFDVALPQIDAQKLLAEALSACHCAHPQMVIVVTSGNHDSAARHEIFRTPWLIHNVHVIGSINPSEPADNIVEISGKGYICAVPFVHERVLPDDYFQKVVNAVPCDNLPIVLTGHLALKGIEFKGHRRVKTDNSEYIGNIRTAEVERIAHGYDYLALGHIHKAQNVHSKRHNSVRYSGSPLPLSFEEALCDHGVSIVDINARGQEPRIEKIIFRPLHKLVTFPDTNEFLKWEEMIERLKDYRPAQSELLRLNIEAETALPADRAAQIETALEGRKARFCAFNVRRPQTRTETVNIRSVNEFREESPLAIAREYAAYKNVEFTDDMVQLFQEVILSLETAKA